MATIQKTELENTQQIKLQVFEISMDVCTELVNEIYTALQKNLHLLIDFNVVTSIDIKTANILLNTYQDVYSHNLSCAWVGCNTALKQQFEICTDISNLNIVPTLQEGMDIINMEVLEREFLSGE